MMCSYESEPVAGRSFSSRVCIQFFKSYEDKRGRADTLDSKLDLGRAYRLTNKRKRHRKGRDTKQRSENDLCDVPRYELRRSRSVTHTIRPLKGSYSSQRMGAL